MTITGAAPLSGLLQYRRQSHWPASQPIDEARVCTQSCRAHSFVTGRPRLLSLLTSNSCELPVRPSGSARAVAGFFRLVRGLARWSAPARRAAQAGDVHQQRDQGGGACADDACSARIHSSPRGRGAGRGGVVLAGPSTAFDRAAAGPRSWSRQRLDEGSPWPFFGLFSSIWA